jgi:hypothetical protein
MGSVRDNQPSHATFTLPVLRGTPGGSKAKNEPSGRAPAELLGLPLLGIRAQVDGHDFVGEYPVEE